MKSSLSWFAIPAEVLLFVNFVASSPPLVARDLGVLEVPRMRSLELPPLHYLAERASSTNLGNFSLATQHNNDVLFSVDLAGHVSAPGKPNLTVICIECFTTGTAALLSTGFTKNQNLLADIPAATEEFITDAKGFIEQALDVTFEVNFQDLAGHFEFDVLFASAGTFTFPLFHPVTPLGASIDGNQIGFVFTIDLIFTVTGKIDATTGFDIIWPNNASIIVDPLKGDIMFMDVSGVQVSPLPLKVRDGSACIQAALRFGLKAGLGINILGSNANIAAGVFVDAPAYKACAIFNSSAACQLGLTETVFADAGAFANIAVKIDFVNFNDGPNVVTTFLSTNLPSVCLASSSKLAIANTTIPSASVTSAPAYRNATGTKSISAITTKAAAWSENATAAIATYPMSIYTLGSCQSNLVWCPPNLQASITVTQSSSLPTTTLSPPPPIIITNAVTITMLSSPQVSTIRAVTVNSTTSTSVQSSGGVFVQQPGNLSWTSVALSTASSAQAISSSAGTNARTSTATSSIAIGAAIMSLGALQSATTSRSGIATAISMGESNKTGTILQTTSTSSQLRYAGFGECAALLGILGSVMFLL